MQIVQVGLRYVIEGSDTYENKDLIKSIGFKWDSEIKKWWTDEFEKFKQLDCEMLLIKTNL
jgi:hypothetical protein